MVELIKGQLHNCFKISYKTVFGRVFLPKIIYGTGFGKTVSKISFITDFLPVIFYNDQSLTNVFLWAASVSHGMFLQEVWAPA